MKTPFFPHPQTMDYQHVVPSLIAVFSAVDVQGDPKKGSLIKTS